MLPTALSVHHSISCPPLFLPACLPACFLFVMLKFNLAHCLRFGQGFFFKSLSSVDSTLASKWINFKLFLSSAVCRKSIWLSCHLNVRLLETAKTVPSPISLFTNTLREKYFQSFRLPTPVSFYFYFYLSRQFHSGLAISPFIWFACCTEIFYFCTGILLFASFPIPLSRQY